jgi:hypothetical protein
MLSEESKSILIEVSKLQFKLTKEIVQSIKMEYIVPDLKVLELVKEYNAALDFIKVDGLNIRTLYPVVLKILKNPTCVDYLCRTDEWFLRSYEYHKTEKLFSLMNDKQSLTAGIIMFKYH